MQPYPRRTIMAKIRVFLTDDHTLFRQGIRTLLSAEPDIEIIGEAPNAGETVESAPDLRPDVVLLDISMPGMSSFQAIRELHKVRPDIKVLLLTMYDDEDYLAEGMEAGADGYILKDSPAEHLLLAIREVHRGGSYMSPKMLAHLVDDFRSRARAEHPVPRFDTLTGREKEVLKLLAEGNSVKEIANDLDLSL